MLLRFPVISEPMYIIVFLAGTPRTPSTEHNGGRFAREVMAKEVRTKRVYLVKKNALAFTLTGSSTNSSILNGDHILAIGENVIPGSDV